MEIAPGIRRLGTGLVNVYLLEEDDAVTVIDAGLPGYWNDLAVELAAMGRSLEDIRAVLLTHAHADHLGFAERLRSEGSVPVQVHADDADLARGERRPRGQDLGRVRPLTAVRFLVYSARRGGVRTRHVREVSTFDDGATLDVPGSPRVIHVPGHTEGSVAFSVASHDALFIGDAIATTNVMNGIRGPQMAPFGSDFGRAVASLERLRELEAKWVLPGHGEAWALGVTAAIDRAREVGMAGR